METHFQGNDAFHFFAPVSSGTSTIWDWIAVSQETELYAEHLSNPRGDVVIDVFRWDSTGTGNGALTVSGYLIDCLGKRALPELNAKVTPEVEAYSDPG